MENATLRIKIKDQDKKAEIYNMMIDEAVVDLEDCIGILCLLDESGLAIRDYLEGKGLLNTTSIMWTNTKGGHKR